MRSVLLVDDDVELCDLLSRYLAAESFDVTCVHEGRSAIERVRQTAPGIVVLDVMLPQMSGFDVLQHIRKVSGVPVLMLTARGDDVDRIVGLEMGADDYLSKPCNPRELVARIRAILRRSATAPAEAGAEVPPALALGDLTLERSRRAVTCGGTSIALTGAEFRVLEALVERPGEIVSKSELTELALERRLSRYDRSIDVHVSRIRKKLGLHPDGTQRIRSVRGAGYLYALPATDVVR